MMTKARFFKNPEYCEYVRLLARLHDLIAAGTDEGPQGEQLRDEMDVCSEGFSDDEIASLHGISGDFYSWTEPPAEPESRTAEAHNQLLDAVSAQRSGDYVTALTLLRQNRNVIEAPRLSYLRGQIFADAGLDEVAMKFFEHASQLDPTI